MAKNDQIVIGWREWIGLPELGLPFIKAKIDTGARTSTLHAFNVKEFYEDGTRKVRFKIHALPVKNKSIECVAAVFDQRVVSDSGGHRSLRFIIKTTIQLGQLCWPIEITLTNRDSMRFRMLLGRTALVQQPLIINPAKSYLISKKPDKL